MKRFRLYFLFVLLPIFTSAQQISFFAEDLNFSLTQDVFEVDGFYHFRNLTDHEVKQMLFFPFPDIKKYGEITFIKIHQKNDTTSALATQSEKGSMFRVCVPANGEIAYRISYGQKVICNEVRYIITTTQNWAKPFEFAKYRMTLPNHIHIHSTSILPDSTAALNEKITWFWEREIFMPDKDFIFEFSVE